MPGRRRPGRHRPVAARTRAAARADADRAAGRGTPGARRHAGRLRPHLDRARRRPTSGCSRSATPTGCRASPRAAPRCWSAAGAVRWSAGSRWTWPSSTSATCRAEPGRPGRPSSGPATTASRPSPSGPRWSDTIEHEIVTGLGARLRRTGPRRRAAERAGEDAGSPSSAAAQNCEHDVSLASAAAVARRAGPRRLRRRRADHRPRRHLVATATATSTWRPPSTLLRTCAVGVPALHGPRGEDGTLAALCDLAGVPYVGSGVGAGALAMDKWATKLVAAALGIGVAPGVLLTARTAASYAWTRPGRGQAGRRRLQPRRHARARPRGPRGRAGGGARAGRPGAGRGPRRRPRGRRRGARPARRRPGRRAGAGDRRSTGSSTTTRSTTAAPTSGSPPRSTDAEREALEDAAVAMYDALGCAGVARVDFFLTDARAGAQRGQHDARASPSSRRCRRCSPPPARRTPSCSTCWCGTPWSHRRDVG